MVFIPLYKSSASWPTSDFDTDYSLGDLLGQNEQGINWATCNTVYEVQNSVYNSSPNSVIGVGANAGEQCYGTINIVSDDEGTVYFRASQTNYSGYVYFRDTGQGEPISGFIALSSDGQIKVWDGSVQVNKGAYSADTWVKFKFKPNFTDDTYQVSINDGAYDTYNMTDGYNYGSWNSVLLSIANYGTFYVDDIVSEVPPEEPPPATSYPLNWAYSPEYMEYIFYLFFITITLFNFILSTAFTFWFLKRILL